MIAVLIILGITVATPVIIKHRRLKRLNNERQKDFEKDINRRVGGDR